MKDIIKSEFYKVRKSVVTKVTAICILAIAGIQALAYVYAKLSGGVWEEIFHGTRGCDTYAYFCTGSFFLVFVAMFIGGMVTNEFTHGTVRQVVSRGVPKAKIALGQYFALSVNMTVIALIPAILLMAVATACWGFGSVSVPRFLLIIFGQLAIIWSYTGISMLIAHITRSGGLAIGLNILFLLGGSLGAEILAILTEKDWILDYWILSMMSYAVDRTLEWEVQFKFGAILIVVGIICTVLGTLRFHVSDVN